MTTSAEAALSANLVDGHWLVGSGEGVSVLDPADLRVVVGRVPAMTHADVSAVYEAAAKGAVTWRHTSALDRASVLIKAARIFRDRQGELAELIVREMGKTRAEATVELAKTADFFDFYASLARLPQGELLADGRPGTQASVRVEPVGVVLAITPWNDPLLTPARKLGPALAAGNAVVIKPSDESPLITLRLAEVFNEAGLPAGVLNTVTGRSRELSGALLHDPHLSAVTFTGSTAVGRIFERELAGRGVRLQAELGGKNASVVLADADLEMAATTVSAAAFAQSGQRCTATSRLVLDESIAHEFVELLRARVESLVARFRPRSGHHDGPGRECRHRDSVLGFVAMAQQQGARVLTGGAAPTDEPLAHGSFVAPTLINGVTQRHAAVERGGLRTRARDHDVQRCR